MPASFTTVDSVRSALGFSGTTYMNAAVELAVNAVNERLTRQLGLSMTGLNTFHEYVEIDRPGRRTFTAERYPVVSVVALTVSGVAVADYRLDKGIGKFTLSEVGAEFPTDADAVEVEYVHGFETIPGDLAQAATHWAAHLYEQAARAGREEDQIRSFYVVMSTAPMPASVASAINAFTDAHR